MILPPFITNLTRCSSVMSTSGSPETAIKSAYLPFSIDPIWFCQPHDFGIDRRATLDRTYGRQAPVPDKHLKVKRLRAVRICGTVSAAAYHDLEPLRRGRHRHGLFED